jgi:hypothetical protein
LNTRRRYSHEDGTVQASFRWGSQSGLAAGSWVSLLGPI